MCVTTDLPAAVSAGHLPASKFSAALAGYSFFSVYLSLRRKTEGKTE